MIYNNTDERLEYFIGGMIMSHIITLEDKEPKIDADTFIADTATVIGDVKLAKGVSIWYNTVIRGDDNTITVGRYTNIQDNTTVHPQADQSMEIGDYVLIGHNAIIHGTKIGNGCLIGMGATLLGYSEIGENCIIGAGTLITQNKKIPPNSMVYGNPARIVRKVTPEEIAEVKKEVLGYYENAKKHMER